MEVSMPHPHPPCLLSPTKANLDTSVAHQMHQYGVIYRLPPSKKGKCFSFLSLFSLSFHISGARDSIFEKLHSEFPIPQILG